MYIYIYIYIYLLRLLILVGTIDGYQRGYESIYY